MLHKLASSWLRGEVSMDSYSSFYAPADLGDEQHVLGLGDFSGSVPTHGAPHSAVC